MITYSMIVHQSHDFPHLVYSSPRVEIASTPILLPQISGQMNTVEKVDRGALLAQEAWLNRDKVTPAWLPDNLETYSFKPKARTATNEFRVDRLTGKVFVSADRYFRPGTGCQTAFATLDLLFDFIEGYDTMQQHMGTIVVRGNECLFNFPTFGKRLKYQLHTLSVHGHYS